MKYTPVPAPVKSAGEQAKDTLVYLVICLVLYYFLTLLAKVFIAPFKYLFMTDRARFAVKIARSKAKIQARKAARELFDTSEANPMYQYLVRFKYASADYKGDPENAKYQKWFESLKNGTILDTGLLWAPEVYLNGTYNEDFLDYFSRQYNLHKVADLKTRIRFMETIRKFYPEFTPRFSVISTELNDLYERLRSKKLHNELAEVISKSGIPMELAKEIVSKDMSSDQIKSAIRTVQKCKAVGWGNAGCKFAVKHGYNPDEHEDYFNEAVNNIIEYAKNEDIALALIRGDISAEELTALAKKALAYGEPEEVQANLAREFLRAIKSKTLKQVVGR
jgi:hypothetical protein